MKLGEAHTAEIYDMDCHAPSGLAMTGVIPAGEKDGGGGILVGSSPETMIRVENNIATLRPIVGTRPRGKTAESDLALEKELLKDEKEIAEHTMLVDWGRNELGRIAKAGTVRVSDLMIIERYSHVMHIVSNIIKITATSEDGEIMGVRHKTLNIEGMQFHPESIMTPQGKKCLRIRAPCRGTG